MKLLLEPIDVGCRNNTPYVVCWRGGAYDVERVLDAWSSRGPWWGIDEVRDYILLETTSGVMEVYKSGQNSWILSRIFD
ncbi:MAG TPA: hypothetical protein VK147_13690 [Candidatus Didemnitutus sp.]|nr:hypothetical protein [Candidatus Didemnitutus sp.]